VVPNLRYRKDIGARFLARSRLDAGVGFMAFSELIGQQDRACRVLLIGATGFIGSALHAALLTQGHDVTATYHRGQPRWPTVRTQWRTVDLSQMSEADWREALSNVDAVVNCAGLLQGNVWESTARVHASGLKILVTACERARVRRLIHFSAIGVDRHVASPFSRTKREGEDVVMDSLLDWIILRPSVVVGRGAFGGSALFRGLAALPILPVMPESGPLQIVQRDDVVSTVLHFLKEDSQARAALDLAGPERHSMTEVIALYRQWLGWRPARQFQVPVSLAHILYRLGDFARALGWRPPLGTTAQREMAFGATGDAGPWQRLTGLVPQRLEDALAREPACVQERWFASLYLLKPVAFAVFSLFWLATGIVSLTVGYPIGIALMQEGGAGALSAPAVVAGALADMAVGATIAFRPTARQGLYGAIALTCLYIVMGTIMVPRLWMEPLGPLMKIFPILVFNLILLAILEER
jgi:uncharacterized protein YbjT (DUF2867 family)